jgi:crotonobetainyl-CoA:carnitine CoA-transferase CaiB-like acyl-CoA transferase
MLGGTREIWRAKDGWITFGLRGGQARIPNLVATVEYMAEEGMAPAWLRAYDFSSYNHNTLARDEARRLEEAFGAFFAGKTRRELYEQALARRIMLAPCNDAREISEQPQLRFRELYTSIEYPELGARFEHPAFFARSSRGGIGVRGRAPRVGEHNREVYGELGLGEAELAALRAEGVI